MKRKMQKLSPQEISAIRKQYEPMKFQNAFDLVYENHIPNTGILLIKGKAQLTRRKKAMETVEPGALLGVHQLVKGEPVKFGCKLQENAEVILLQKSDLLEAMEDENSPLHPYLDKI